MAMPIQRICQDKIEVEKIRYLQSQISLLDFENQSKH